MNLQIEAHRSRVLAMLAGNPALRIPREKWDRVLFLEMLERHTIH